MTGWVLPLSAQFGLALALPGVAQEPYLSNLCSQQIIVAAPEFQPAALKVLASRSLAQGRGQDAANETYGGQR